jgi:hypothetical protein
MGSKLVGEECVYSSQCSTLQCDASGSCGKCVEVVGLDQACGASKGCTGSAVCDQITNTCRPWSQFAPGVGGTCAGGLCRRGSYCSKDQLCVENPKPGQACGDGTRCDYPNDYCRQQDATCQPPPGAGQPCGVGISAGSRYCAEGTNCVNEICVPLPVDGQPCVFGNVCAAGFACDSLVIEVTGTCHPGAKGDPCVANDFACAKGLSCDGDICKNTVGPEMPCSDGTTLCLLGTCDGGVCVAPDDQRRFSMSCGP